jgi:hypothetical protein
MLIDVNMLDKQARCEDLPLRGLGILGSGWQMQTCAVESPLLALVWIGVTSWLSISLSSPSTTLTPRFLVGRDGGDSSGVRGAFELPDMLGALLSERVETFDEALRLVLAFAWYADSDPCD